MNATSCLTFRRFIGSSWDTDIDVLMTKHVHNRDPTWRRFLDSRIRSILFSNSRIDLLLLFYIYDSKDNNRYCIFNPKYKLLSNLLCIHERNCKINLCDGRNAFPWTIYLVFCLTGRRRTMESTSKLMMMSIWTWIVQPTNRLWSVQLIFNTSASKTEMSPATLRTHCVYYSRLLYLLVSCRPYAPCISICNFLLSVKAQRGKQHVLIRMKANDFCFEQYPHSINARDLQKFTRHSQTGGMASDWYAIWIAKIDTIHVAVGTSRNLFCESSRKHRHSHAYTDPCTHYIFRW